MGGADLERALAHYRKLAPHYDHYTRRIDAIRLQTIAALELQPGDTVLDAGCGTGWCIPHLLEMVGPTGHVIGFDPSEEMLALARRYATDPARVSLVHDTAQSVQLPRTPDAILFSYTHDVIQSRDALSNLFAQCRSGARVAATGTKLYATWLAPANWYLRLTHRAYITNFESFAAPWSVLQESLDAFAVRTHGATQHYVATGKVRG